jgi:PTS system mannose-specific IID component
MTISKDLWLKTIWRSFFIQGAWNFEGMQNIGFVYGLLPGLKDIHGENKEKLEAAIKRYGTFFNTQPYMAPLIMGVTLSEEKKGNIPTDECAARLHSTMSNTLAAIGDSFFWATLKPILALFILLSIMTGFVSSVILGLILFNALHIGFAAKGFKSGYENGPDAVIKVGKSMSMDRIERIKYLIPFMGGMVLFFVPSYMGASLPPVTGLLLIIGLMIFVILDQLKIHAVASFYISFIALMGWFILQ